MRGKWIGCGVVGALLASALLSSAFAQGSEGGSIGGRIAAPAPAAAPAVAPRAPAAPRPAPVATAPRAPRTIGNVDGAWAVSASGGCAAAGSNQVIVSGGRITGQGVSGTVTPAGVVSTRGVISGLVVVGRGRMNGRTGSGTYQQSDGCSGAWSATKL